MQLQCAPAHVGTSHPLETGDCQGGHIGVSPLDVLFLLPFLSAQAERNGAPAGKQAPPGGPRPGQGKKDPGAECLGISHVLFETAVPWGPMITCIIAGGSPPHRFSASNVRERSQCRRGRPAIHGRSQSASLINSVGPYEAEKSTNTAVIKQGFPNVGNYSPSSGSSSSSSKTSSM